MILSKKSKFDRKKMTLRGKLVDIALEWQESFGVAPSITSAISEYDAAMLIGMPQNEYSEYMKDKTAVSKGADFVYKNTRYQVKANRPSGKKGQSSDNGAKKLLITNGINLFGFYMIKNI